MTSSKYLVCQQSDTTLGDSVYVRWAAIVKAYICLYFYGEIADWKKGLAQVQGLRTVKFVIRWYY